MRRDFRFRAVDCAAVFAWTLLGLLITTASGQTGGGNGLSFDGVNDFVAVSNSPSLNAYPLTVMGWFRSFDNGLDRGLVNKYVVSSLNGYQVILYQGHLRAWYFRDSANNIYDGGQGLDGGFVLGIWQHFAFTVDATGGKLYVNGSLRASRAWTGTPGPCTQAQDVWLGRYANNFLSGQLDEVSIWNVALSSNAIQSAMSRRLETNEVGLLAYWRFEEGQGNATADAIPQAAGDNGGTLFNGVSWAPSGAIIGPLVNTKGISSQTIDGHVALNGEVNPLGRDTTAWFEWGTSTLYGNRTTPISVGLASNYVTARALISGLSQGQTYHYRYVATNLNGRANGVDQSFIQPVFPPAGGVPPLRSSAYDGQFLSYTAYDPAAEWDTSVAMTIEAWVYRRDASRYEAVVSHDAPGSYWLGFSPMLRFYRGTNYAEVPNIVPALKWTHVAVSYDGAVARFYINGDYVGARALSNTGTGKIRELLLGHDDSHNSDIGPQNRFYGNLDEVRIWSVARSGAEIRDGIYREVRGEPGLAAAFPRGGRFEEVHGLVGAVGGGVSEQVFGMVPRDLVVPRAAIPPSADGSINLATEYLGAEQLVLRYPDLPWHPDMTAYFVHTDTNLFVAVTVFATDSTIGIPTNSWLSLFIDTTNGRPLLAEYPQVELRAYTDGNANHSAWLNGDGGGSYYACFTPPGIGPPRPCTPRSLWQVGEFYCNGEINPDLCMEFRISKDLLGSWDEFDGVAMGQFNINQFGDQVFIPENGYPDSPATWLTMSYGQGSANLPRVLWNGRVFAGLTNTSPGLAGQRVSLFAGGAAYSQLTDASGRFSFDVPLPTGQVIYAQVDNVGFGRYRLPAIGQSGYQPQYVFTNDVRYPGLPANVSGITQLASVDFYIQKPLGPSAITSASPTNPMCGTIVRVGIPGGPGEVVTLFGSNLHSEMEFYLSPYTTQMPDPSQWTLIRAQTLEMAADRSWVKVQAPFVPESVREYSNGFFVVSFQSPWRWVSRDRWFRPGAPEYSYFGQFPIQRPPYPLMHGFHFENDQTFPGLEEFLATYGYNAYICVGAFGHCATHVPDPLYWILWYPVHFIVIGMSGGSCVGMSGTSMQLFNGSLTPQSFDPLALAANGISDTGLPGDWDTGNTGGIYTRPPIPKDIWARIRMNHGTQTSAEYMVHVLSQLDIGVLSPSFGGDPNARLPALRANPTRLAVSMVPGVGGGHCVMPYRVEDNFGGDPNISRIWIYDNEVPCAMGAAATDDCVTNQFIDINRANNTYHYPRGDWTGTGLFTTPLSIYDGEHHAPGLDDFVEALAVLTAVVVGDADAHYTSPAGEWGWRADGTFVDNMPGLRSITPIGSSRNQTHAVPVFLTFSNSAAISNLVIDINPRGTNSHIFHVAAQGTFLQLESPTGPIGTSNRVRLGAVSNQLVSFQFRPQAAHSNFIPKVGFQMSNGASAVFQWMGLKSEGGMVQEFRALKGKRAVEYCNLTGKATQHYLRIDAVDGATSNNTCALFGPFTVPTGAVHCVVLQDWPRARQVRSELDLNADGTPDEVTVVTGTPIDTDGDGMPDDWELSNQLNPNAVTCDDGPDADPDHDGVSNYGEYLSGTDPHDATSVLRLWANIMPGNKVRLTWSAVVGRRYELLAAPGLEYVFQPMGRVFPRVATSPEETFEDTLPAGVARYYRLRVLPP